MDSLPEIILQQIYLEINDFSIVLRDQCVCSLFCRVLSTLPLAIHCDRIANQILGHKRLYPRITAMKVFYPKAKMGGNFAAFMEMAQDMCSLRELELVLHQDTISDEFCEEIKRFTQLRVLCIESTVQHSPALFRSIGYLQKLQSMKLVWKHSPNGMNEMFSRLTNLKYLTMDAIPNETIRIPASTLGLVVYSLASRQVIPLDVIANSTKLASLAWRSQMTDADVQILAQQTNLQELELVYRAGTPLSQYFWEHIPSSLRVLTLANMETPCLFVRPHDNLQSLDIDYVFSSNPEKCIFSDLRQVPNLTSLNLSSVEVAGPQCFSLAAGLMGLNCLRSLTMNKCVSSELFDAALCPILLNFASLTYLNLNDNSMEDRCYQDLGEAIAKMPLRVLSLSNNQIGSSFGSLTTSICQLSKLLSLDLSANAFLKMSKSSSVEPLPCSLTKLSLQKCNIENAEMVDKLLSNCGKLQELKLNGNRIAPNAAVKLLGRCCSTLTYLSVDNNHDAKIQAFVKQSCPRLTTLSGIGYSISDILG